MVVTGALAASTTLAVPLVPRIESHDFNFGGYEPAGSDADAFYAPRGADPDWLTLSGMDTDREVTAFWEVWPSGVPRPVFNLGGDFGGDIELYLAFDGHDEAPPHLDVSLTGAGRNAGADLIITGTLDTPAGPISGTLLSIDIDVASLYGFGGASSYVLETAGTILSIHPDIDIDQGTLVGERAVSRGNIDFNELTLASGYDPLVRYAGAFNDGGGYSGEVGAGFETVPEPASMLLLAAGLPFVFRRR